MNIYEWMGKYSAPGGTQKLNTQSRITCMRIFPPSAIKNKALFYMFIFYNFKFLLKFYRLQTIKELQATWSQAASKIRNLSFTLKILADKPIRVLTTVKMPLLTKANRSYWHRCQFIVPRNKGELPWHKSSTLT